MKVNFLFISLFCILFLSACLQKETLPPLDNAFVLLLVDLHIAEGAAANLTSRSRDTLLPAYYQQVFEIHQIEEASWRAKMEELQRHPAALSRMYKAVTDTLEVRVLESREK